MADGSAKDDVSIQFEIIEAVARSADAATLARLRDLVVGLAGEMPQPTGEAGGNATSEVVSESPPVEPQAAGTIAAEMGGKPETAAPVKPPLVRKTVIQDIWTETLLAQILPASGPLPLRPVTLGIIECADSFPERVAIALKGESTDDLSKYVYESVVHDVDALLKRKAYDTGAKLQPALRREMLNGNAVVLCTQGNLPPGITAMATWKLSLSDLGPRLLAFARKMRELGFPLDMEDGTHFEDRWPADRVVPYERLGGVWGWLWSVCEQDVKPITQDVLQRLEETVGNVVADGPGIAPGGPASFDEVPGLHPATRSRLGMLVERMRSETDSPPGILLEGPPGTGKTMLAGLIARGTGRTFVETSATEWVSAAHLGETLAMMRGRFAEARKCAPSLIFIDELDTMGRRGKDDRNEQWTRMFINGLLECLQGLGGRGDVAVVAATNHSASIDPAILREGRIGEHIEVALPTRTGRREVLDFYLPEGLRSQVDTLVLADRVGRCSPAKIRALAEETILQGKGAPTPDDLEVAFKVMAGKLARGHDPASLALPVCSGLAGEALMTVLAYGEAARIDGISARPGLADLGRVSVTHRREEPPSTTAGDLRKLLHVAMAPGVARGIVAGRLAKGREPLAALEVFSSITGGEIAHARMWASILARSGMANTETLSWQEEARVNAEMADARKHVRRALVRCKETLFLLTALLQREGGVTGDAFERLVGIGRQSSLPTLH